MKNYIKRGLLKVFGQLIVGFSIMYIQNLGSFFLISWIAGWIIYDLHYRYN
jgi:hypothetical protein